MRVLAAADIHGFFVVYEWLVELARTSADVLLLGGDLLTGDIASAQQEQAREVIAILKSLTVPVLYIMGNDDNVSLNYEDALIRSIHGQRVDMAHCNFVGYQYTPPFVGEEFVKPLYEIDSDLKAMETFMDEQTVLVTHAPALGTLDEVYGNNVGSSSIAALLQRRPVLAHIHGHIHQQFGRSGQHFNVAAAGMCRAMFIEIPSLRHTVVSKG